jgi:hypothetical protein
MTQLEHTNRGLAPMPWYRQPWPWILMAGPAVVIVAGLVTAWLAATSFDGLVADDYYKQGLAVNRVLARNERARQLAVRGMLEISPMAASAVDVSLTSLDGNTPPALELAVIHPTRPGFDQHVVLTAIGPRRYGGQIKPLSPGHWRLVVQDAKGEWRIGGELNLPRQHAAELGPGQ